MSTEIAPGFTTDDLQTLEEGARRVRVLSKEVQAALLEYREVLVKRAAAELLLDSGGIVTDPFMEITSALADAIWDLSVEVSEEVFRDAEGEARRRVQNV